jgi:excisionase family DNA binding protein
MPEPSALLTASEVAERLRVSPIHIVKLCRAGKIPATKPLGTWLIPAAWVDQAVADGFNQQQAS